MPLVNLHGIYILPGIPRLFKSMVDAHKDRFKGLAYKSRTLYTNTVEGDLAGDSGAVHQNEAIQNLYICLSPYVIGEYICEPEVLDQKPPLGRQRKVFSFILECSQPIR